MTRSDRPASAEPNPRRWLTLAVLLLAGFMNLIDVTIVNVAIPSLRDDLGATSSQIEWVVAAYIIAFALGLLPFGRLGDIVGRKRMFLMGVSGFTLCSLLCGMSPTIGILVVARALQGLTGAMMMPQVLALVQVTFPPEERGFAFSFFGVTAGLASVAGPLAGGALISADIYDLAWRPIFLVNLPVGLFAIAAGWTLIPTTEGGRREPLDFVGILLAAAAIFSVVIPLVEGREFGWPLWCFALLATSLPLAAGFIAWERRRERRGTTQLLPVKLMENRHFLLGLAMTSALFAGIPGFFFVVAIFLQVGFDYSPLQSGLATVPFPVGVLIASLISGRFGSRMAKARLIVGPLILAAGMAILYAVVGGVTDSVSHWSLLPPLFLCGLGMGITVAPLFATILMVVETRDAGSGSGMLQSFQQIGGALGVAIVGEIFFGTLGGQTASHAGYRDAFEAALVYQIAIFLILAFLASRLKVPDRQRENPRSARLPAEA
ncbi:MFS transporter [Aurantimonas sp. VKM B-3413]|uniref:MFS transporter n=1 Tax=Aurantimonas sp. VKM B-3413 TaxID=2779401 RepID=UPI001E3F6003|nr:MFS transporter [Aurantimonas sp. VKM B-3413]MCB8837228.1 MFS transporter [Aurantimonas sp. VKM B-3413]